ncbi:RagB/SusD family nutrient uptake outer membrane protein [Capnocytophaga catalasegens]|uniref:Membrane protein n=1 Tax=Capnocytophaga catalasegens TaxID=1004260 RepID=A0AAV5APM0_9FLAO|nr:RagB/SusD family nutrient uptake outer membrane protein [Capnocytophaga catalasegens]GIZ14878.1 membrane protein [Capnocytophaga catalasegens]GJM49256.1 membrane protein [Capnocytophaga catalasegens]GJM52406.1 membrane protein [Capnocytophaga catalasegens]
MKRYIFIVITLFTFNACNLETPPESDLTYDSFWEKEEAAKSVFDGIYSKFRSYGDKMWQMGELRSDMWGGKGIENAHNQNLFTNDINTTKVPFNDWGNWYTMLHYINDFIKNAPKAPFSNTSERDNMLAQMYGLRAYIYYVLVKSWGDVPIVLQPLQNIDNLASLKTPRAPKEKVMAQIKSDIQKSLELFNGNENFYKNRVYWSKMATLTLKGDVYLWSGKVLGGGNQDYNEAKNALNQISGYSLVPYDKLWGVDNENNQEFILVLDYKKDEATHYYGVTTARNADIKDKYDDQGRKISTFLYVEGGNYNSPSNKTLLLIDDVKDLRRASFIRIYQDNAGYIPFTADNTKYMGSVLSKFVGRNESGVIINENNIPIYRYADVLLLLAEVKNNLGEDPSTEINQIRQRAYGSNYVVGTHGYTNASQAVNAKAILDERYKEFIGEGKRWWDLLRAGDNFVYDEVTSMLDSGGAKKPIYLPITAAMIADDNTLEQTKGY